MKTLNMTAMIEAGVTLEEWLDATPSQQEDLFKRFPGPEVKVRYEDEPDEPDYDDPEWEDPRIAEADYRHDELRDRLWEREQAEKRGEEVDW